MNNKLSLLVNFVAVDKLSGAMKNIVSLGGKGSSSLRALNAEQRRLNSEIRRYDGLIAKTSGNATALWSRQKSLMLEQENLQKRINRQQRLAVIEADRKVMARRGDELKGKGTNNMAGGAALSAPVILAVKAAADFSSGMVDIQQKAELSNRETDAMANNIIRAAAAARQMPEDMRAGVDVLAGFGIDPRIAERMIAPIGRLGTAFKVEIADGASAAYANLNNLKVPVNQTARALDIMAAAGNAGAFEVKDMARHFPTLTAQMQALGQKGVPAVTDLSAALQIARRGAGDADEAANNIKNLLTKINAPATIKAFDKNFGVDLPAAMKKAYREGKTPMEAIAEITRKATGGDLSKLGFAFEDMQAQSALRALILNLDDYRKMRADIAKSSGTTDRAFAQRAARDATVNWRAFLGTASMLAITLGSTLLPVMTETLGTVNHAATAFGAWAQANPQLAGFLMKSVAAIAAFRVGLGAAQFVIGSFLGPFASVLSWVRRAGPVFGVLRTAVLFLGRGFLQAGAMMLANPIVLIITAVVVAIGVAAYLIYTHWDKIKATFTAGWNWIKSTLASAPAWLRSIGGAMMQGLLNMIDPFGLSNRLLQVARNGIAAFKNFFGIKSPSRLMMLMGGHITGGLSRGIEGGRHQPVRAIGRVAAGIAAGAGVALTPMASARPARASGMASAPASITVHIYAQPGQSADDIADRVIRKIEQKQAVRSRSAYQDDR